MQGESHHKTTVGRNLGQNSVKKGQKCFLPFGAHNLGWYHQYENKYKGQTG